MVKKTIGIIDAVIFYRSIAILSQKIQENRFDSEAYERRGACYEYLGNETYALEDYTSAITYDPLPHHYKSRAHLYLTMGKYAECIADCDMALEIEERMNDERSIFHASSGVRIIKAEAIELYNEEIHAE